MSWGNATAATTAALGWAVAVWAATAGRWPVAGLATALGVLGLAGLARARAARRRAERAASADRAAALWPARRFDGPWSPYDRRRTNPTSELSGVAAPGERHPRDEKAPAG